MIRKNRKLKDQLIFFAKLLSDILFPVFVFLIPTQLGYHFWPKWSLVSGVRIDYLSPTIYLTDVFVFVIFLLSIVRLILVQGVSQKLTRGTNRGLSVFVILFFGFFFINIFAAINVLASLLFWIRIFECVFLVLYIRYLNKLSSDIWFYKPIVLSALTFGLIGFCQFVSGSSLGGLLYYFGERTFTKQTYGISLFVWKGQEFLRAYSTFPHPNALAGFLATVLLLVFFGRRFSPRTTVLISSIIFFFLLSTFSKNAIASLTFILISFKISTNIIKKHSALIVRKIVPYVPPIIFLANLSLIPFSYSVFSSKLPENVSYRLYSTKVAGIEFAASPIYGMGFNGFINGMVQNFSTNKLTWFLQPVHNVYLLVFSEGGLVGYIFFFIGFSYFIKKLVKTKKPELIAVFVFIATTSALDHYWLTLQPNRLLLTLFVSLVILNYKSVYNKNY